MLKKIIKPWIVAFKFFPNFELSKNQITMMIDEKKKYNWYLEKWVFGKMFKKCKSQGVDNVRQETIRTLAFFLHLILSKTKQKVKQAKNGLFVR